jgi:predicted secreted protein
MTGFLHYVVLFGAFVICWFLCLFCLLPVGMGAARDPETNAPLSPMLGRKALVATAIAVVLWVIFYAGIRLGWMQL